MRASVITTFALALALVPAVALAQATTSTQPPPAGQAAPAQPAPEKPALKIPLDTPAGVLLVQIKPGKGAVFEEMFAKLKAGLAKTQDETLKKQAAGIKMYKSAEPFGANILYVVMIEPAVPLAEYDLFQMVSKTMTPDELRAPEAAKMWERYVDAFAAGINKLSLTQIGG